MNVSKFAKLELNAGLHNNEQLSNFIFSFFFLFILYNNRATEIKLRLSWSCFSLMNVFV